MIPFERFHRRSRSINHPCRHLRRAVADSASPRSISPAQGGFFGSIRVTGDVGHSTGTLARSAFSPHRPLWNGRFSDGRAKFTRMPQPESAAFPATRGNTRAPAGPPGPRGPRTRRAAALNRTNPASRRTRAAVRLETGPPPERQHPDTAQFPCHAERTTGAAILDRLPDYRGAERNRTISHRHGRFPLLPINRARVDR